MDFARHALEGGGSGTVYNTMGHIHTYVRIHLKISSSSNKKDKQFFTSILSTKIDNLSIDYPNYPYGSVWISRDMSLGGHKSLFKFRHSCDSTFVKNSTVITPATKTRLGAVANNI